VIIFRRYDGSNAFSGILKENLYLVDFNSKELELDKCLIAKKTSMDWLWHHSLAHVGMRNLYRVQKEGQVLGLMNMNVALKKDMPCGASKWVHNIVQRTS
jgi:hypothetical protein